MRRITSEGLELIRKYEGFRGQPYICPAGWLTVGYGHVVRAGENFADGVTEQQAMELLAKDVATSEKAVLRLVNVPLVDGQFGALVSFVFNLGAGSFQRSTLRQKVNRLEHELVPGELMKWVYAGGRKLPGLVRRRAEEAALYRGWRGKY